MMVGDFFATRQPPSTKDSAKRTSSWRRGAGLCSGRVRFNSFAKATESGESVTSPVGVGVVRVKDGCCSGIV